MRSKSYRRHQNRRVSVHKQGIVENVYHMPVEVYTNGRGLHSLSKNKVHCSCPLCAAKTKTHGPTAHDMREIDRTKWSETE